MRRSNHKDSRRGFVAIALLAALTMPLSSCQWLTGSEPLSPKELHSQIQAQTAPVILDVRSAAEYEAGHIPGAINIDYRELSQRLDELPTDQGNAIVVYCERGVRAAIAETTLNNAGFTQIFHLTGDMTAWRSQGLPVE